MIKNLSPALQNELVNRYGLRLYNRLSDTGADLIYINYLDRWLQLADAITSIDNKHWKDSKRQMRKKTSSSTTSSDTLKATSIKLEAFVTGFKRSALENNPSDPLLNPNDPKFTSRLSHVMRRGAELIVKKNLEDAKAQIIREFGEHPLIDVCLTYIPSSVEYSKGGTQDLRGSFFLLAVTEHLKKKRGCYELAAQLLSTIRGWESKRPPLQTSSKSDLSRKRIQSLKKCRPGWANHLDMVALAFRARK